MRFVSVLGWISAVAAIDFRRTLPGPASIEQLLELAFPDGDAPQFSAIPGTSNIVVAQNDTASLKINSLSITPYPLRPGYIDFQLVHSLTKDWPADSLLHITSFKGNEPAFEGSVNICEFMPFAKLTCPLAKYTRLRTMTQTLDVPKDAEEARYSFVAKITSPDGGLIAHIAALIDIFNDEEIHDEL